MTLTSIAAIGPLIGNPMAAQNLSRDGYPVLASIHRLTPRQACDALAFLSGYAPDATARALDHVTAEHVVAERTGGYEGREVA